MPELGQEAAQSGWPTMSGIGEIILFCCVAAIMIIAALGVLFLKRAAYSALCMVVVMLGISVLFFALQAPFNGIVQVVVYTGAIMMLFLFVIMMIGLSARDGFEEQRKGYIITAVGLGIVLAGVGAGAVLQSTIQGPGKIDADPYTNEPVTGLARVLFTDHWLTIELAGMLLITAALGAVLMTNSDRLRAKFNQRATVNARMKEYAAKGVHPGQLPAPGVYADSNSVDNPAISGELQSPIVESIPRVLRVRGLGKPMGALEPEVRESVQLARIDRSAQTLWATKADVPQSKAWGMGGAKPPTGLMQVKQSDLAEGETR
jgi:NADH:ubiquinone oxidoreductase subunit 6 (chain J)